MSADNKVNLVVNQKASFEVTFTLKNNGVAIDLDGYSYAAKLKLNYESADNTAVSFATSSANTAAGQLTIALTSTQTAALKEPRYVYDVVITNGSTGFKTRVVEGTIRVDKGVA